VERPTLSVTALPTAPEAAFATRKRLARPAGGSAATDGAPSGGTPALAPPPAAAAAADGDDGGGGGDAEATAATTASADAATDALIARSVMDRVDAEPDYKFAAAAERRRGTYDLDSALLGEGSPNKQGVYLTPYIQTGHVIALLVFGLAAFVDYPGFPLTEGTDVQRGVIKVGLAAAAVNNAIAVALIRGEAAARGQLVGLWAAKAVVLGGLARKELKENAAVVGEGGSPDARRKAEKRAARAKKARGDE